MCSFVCLLACFFVCLLDYLCLFVCFFISIRATRNQPMLIILWSTKSQQLLQIAAQVWIRCPFGGCLVQDRLQTRIEAKFLAKLRPRWPHHGRSWGQVVSKMVQVRAKLAPRWANFAPRWPTWCPFGGCLAQDGLKTRIEAKFLAKLRPRWPHHGRSWGQVVSKMVQVRAKLAPRWANFAPRWAT